MAIKAAAAYPMDETRLFFSNRFMIWVSRLAAAAISIHLFGSFCQFKAILFKQLKPLIRDL